jgi:RloB-like protein
MGKDNQPKHRQLVRTLKRRAAQRAPYERLLIVCEGEKTEPHYLQEIKNEYRLSTANVQVWPSEKGTESTQVIEFAEELFHDGDRQKGIEPRSFDRVITVFDRDDHATYHNALAKSSALDAKRLKNDLKEPVHFEAVASVPCFELWLLLHFEDVQTPTRRDEVYKRLKVHLPIYDKAQGGHWAKTKNKLEIAVQRAHARAMVTSAHDGNETYTDMHKLVLRLSTLKK